MSGTHLPASHSEQKSQHIRLLLLVQFLNVLERTHLQTRSEQCVTDLNWIDKILSGFSLVEQPGIGMENYAL